MVAEQFIIKEPVVNLRGRDLGIGSLRLLSLFLFFLLYIYLAMSGLSCGMWDL